MTKEELLVHLDRLIQDADITGIGLQVIRENLDDIHKHLSQLEEHQRSTVETPEQE